MVFDTIKNIFKKKNIPRLNDDYMREILQYMGPHDLTTLAKIRNHGIRNAAREAFVKNNGREITISIQNMETSLHLMKKVTIRFHRLDIPRILEFVQNNLLANDLEELVLIHTVEDNPSKSGEDQLGQYLESLNGRFKSLKKFTLKYENLDKWCSYAKRIPFFAKATSITLCYTFGINATEWTLDVGGSI